MSLKDFEYVKRLDRKGLEDYYMCYHHHRHHRHNRTLCHDSFNRSVSSLSMTSKDLSCPCVCEKEHYCTAGNNTPNLTMEKTDMSFEANEDPSIALCEHYKPSYTSKEDQLSHLKGHLYDLKKSKNMMKSTMAEIDRLLAETGTGDDDLDDVEKFYRSNKFIGSSLNISSMKMPPSCHHSYLRPKSAARYIHELNDLKGAKNKKKLVKYPHGNALFTYYSPAPPATNKNDANKKETKTATATFGSPLVICRIK